MTPEEKREYNKAWKLKNPDYHKLYKRRWRELNPDKQKELTARYTKNSRAWEQRNPEKTKARWAEYRKANRAKRNASYARWRAQQYLATPMWADLFKVHEFYKLALRLSKETGVAHHVDHIVPLRSKLVCGLHCEANLRVIPATDNYKKNNRVWPDMPDG